MNFLLTYVLYKNENRIKIFFFTDKEKLLNLILQLSGDYKFDSDRD